MTEKWKQRAIHMNFRKAVIIFLITGIVLMIAIPAVLYGNFQNRIALWEQSRRAEKVSQETVRDFREDDEESSWKSERDSRENEESGFDDRERERDSREREEREGKDLEDMLKNIPLSWGDFALLAGSATVVAALGIWYWILVMTWAYRKAHRMGVNGGLAVLAALFFNVAALSLYGLLKGSCANCGRVRSGNGKFCPGCGSPLKKECPQCGQEVYALSAYCRNCGKKLDETEKSEGIRETQEAKETEIAKAEK